jgi:hypothetical protein
LLFGQKIVEIWFLQLSRKAVIGFVVAFWNNSMNEILILTRYCLYLFIEDVQSLSIHRNRNTQSGAKTSCENIMIPSFVHIIMQYSKSDPELSLLSWPVKFYVRAPFSSHCKTHFFWHVLGEIIISTFFWTEESSQDLLRSYLWISCGSDISHLSKFVVPGAG